MSTPSDVALILTPVSVVAVAVINVFNGRRMGRVHDDVREGNRVGRQIDAAVNGKGPGESSLSQDMTTVLDKQERDHPTEVEPNGTAGIRGELAALRADIAELKGRT